MTMTGEITEFRVFTHLRPLCPRCREPQVAAIDAASADDGAVRNLWSCDACDFTFQTRLDRRDQHIAA